MSRYIKLDDAIASIAGQMSYEIEAETGEKTDCLDLAEELLNDIPTVSVVRCGECKHMYDGIKGDGYLICHKFNHFIKADDFCSYGERSDNGEYIQSTDER